MNKNTSATERTINSALPGRTSRPLISSLGMSPYLAEDISLFIEDVRNWLKQRKKTAQK